MEKSYDVIVIGAGNAGLMAALKVAEKGKKVLLLESNNIPGDMASNYKRGRFEFENTFQIVTKLGTKEDKGKLRKIFDEYDLNNEIEWIELKEAYKLVKLDQPKETYILPLGLDEFIKKLEEYEPGSKDKVTEFFELAKETYEGYEYIKETNNIDYDYIKEKYPNFMNLSSYTVDTVFKKLKLPEKVEEILLSYWINIGTSSVNLNFAQYVSELYEFISKKIYIPKNTNYEISCALEKKIREFGGDVWYNEKVSKILINDNKITGVLTQKNQTILTNHIICNSSPINLYSSLLDTKDIPTKQLQLTNSRILGLKLFSISVGLNKNIDDLGITNYMSYIYSSLNSDKEKENIRNINPSTMIVTCPNVLISDASPENTSIINISIFYNGDIWDKTLNEANYYLIREKIANKAINKVEAALDINIHDYIEEIDIQTPLTYIKYNDNTDGCIYGYMPNNNDSILYRLFSKEENNPINGLRLCGSYSYYGHGNDNTYINGYEVGVDTLNDIEGGNYEKN